MVCLGFFNSHLWSVWIGRSVRRRGKRDMRRFTLPHVGFATSVLTLWVMTEHKYLLHVFVSLIIIIIISMSLVFYYSINIYLKEPAFFSVSLIN
jgi:phosphoglycerol transferase MdoB-like AlkP superfamily enzyme